ncbi:MAG: DUF1801 domain-containing protein [Devosia sp.]|nr:DUF1801 domain-containing protein [Devosia sp.]
MAKTVDDYIAAQPPDVAHILERLRETIHKAAPGATETIKYGMPVFRHGDGYIFYLGAWNKHIGLYPIHPQPPGIEADLAPLRGSKDTAKLVYARPIPYGLVTRIVKARLKQLRAEAP